MASRFSRPRLIDANDKQYRAFVAGIMMTRDNYRPSRPPLARELFGGEAELALRGWLSQHFTLSDRRLVEYLEHRGRSAIKKYRELDAVVLDSPKSVQVFEVKASQKASSLRRASQQLRDTRTILQMLYPRVLTTILLVDTGIPKTAADVAALMAAEDAPFEPPPTLDEVLATLPHVKRVATLDERDPATVGLLCFTVEQIIALAGAENLHLNWDEEETAGAEDADADAEAAEADRYAYTTSAEAADEQDDDNPLAAALRKAMEGQH